MAMTSLPARTPDATRKRRSRLHAAGDHAACLPGHCAIAGEAQRLAAGSVSASVAGFLAGLSAFEDDDPRAVTAALCVRLAGMVDNATSGANMSNVSTTLSALVRDLAAHPSGPASALDKVKLSARLKFLAGDLDAATITGAQDAAEIPARLR